MFQLQVGINDMSREYVASNHRDGLKNNVSVAQPVLPPPPPPPPVAPM